MRGEAAAGTKTGTLMRPLVLWGPVIGALLLSLGVGVQPWVDARLVFLDPLAAAQTAPCCHAYFGAMSTLGVFGWAMAAGLCALTAAVLAARSDRRAGFFLAAAALTALLGLDDALMIHETAGPRLGVAQNLVLALYAALGAVYCWVARNRVVEPGGALLVVAIAGFGVSLGIDVVLSGSQAWVAVVEDAAKFVGITAWLMFHGAIAFDALTVPENAQAK